MFETKNVFTSYGKRSVLKDINITMKEGELITIVGANGAGKTTLLKTISGLVMPISGTIVFQGKRVDRLATEKIIRLGIAMVPEKRGLFTNMTVRENLEMGAYLRVNKEDLGKDIEFVNGLFPILRKRFKQIAGTLSGGEQQMLAIGRGLMAKPQLFMLDEPSLGLAPLITQHIFSVIQNLNRQGTSILLVEQNVKISLELANRAYVLETGKISLEGRGRELLDNENVKKFYLGM